MTYGEVKSVEDGKITIAVGTMKDMGGNGGAPEKPDENGSGDASADTSDAESTESDSKDAESDKTDSKDGDSTDNGEAPEKPDGDNADGNGGAPGGDQGEAPSMLDLTGDEMTVTVTDDTVITKESAEGPGGAPGGNQGEAPEKSDGDNGNNQAPGGDQGGAPDGNNSQSETIELSDIQEGDIVAITTDDGNALTIKVQSTDMGGGQGGPGGAPGGQSQGVDSYDTANTYDSDTEVSDTSLESTGTDENAALVSSGANVTFNNIDITRNSSDSTGGDNSSFYGVGAALLATDGNAYVKGGTVTTDAAGGAGLFAYGDGTVYAADTTIKTTQDTSGGIHAAGGGKLYAWDLNVETDGESAAAIRSDRGGGTLTSKNGGVFYTTNTESDITLKDVDITYNNDNEYFLRCTGNNNERGWGESGANGADCDFTAISQDMEGSVIWDTISQLDFYMTDGSNLTGAIIDDESFAGNGGDGYCNVYVSDDSTWTVTGDSTVSKLSNAGTIVDDSGKTVTVKGTDGTVYVEGDSDYTITVDKYEDTADTSGSDTVASWSDYEVEKPDTL